MFQSSFNPKFSTVKARVITGKRVADNLIRFQAEVSSLRHGDKAVTALASAFDDNAKVLANTLYEKGNTRGGGKIVEGFAIARPLSYSLDTANWLEQASANHGVSLKEIAKNMYMDDDEQCWSVKHVGDTTVISREGTDEVFELLASANLRNDSKSDTIHPIMSNRQHGLVAFVNSEGGTDGGIAIAGVDGDKDKIQILRYNHVNEEPVIASIYQVIAYQALDSNGRSVKVGSDSTIDYDADPLAYYRTLYSNDPAMMAILEQYIDL